MTEHRGPDDGGPARPEIVPVGDARRILFMAAAYLLRYPDDALRRVLPEVAGSLHALADAAPAAMLVRAAEALAAGDPFELAARYVATFDLREPTALHLTAHEFGDSRRRGPALVELRQTLRAGGFEPVGGELPDYLPLLLEFLAHTPEDGDTGDLERRLAAVCGRIRGHLPPESLYAPVFGALLALLPEIPLGDEASRFPGRERADTGTMPYPLRYE